MTASMSTTKGTVIWEENVSIEPTKNSETSGESGVCDITIGTNGSNGNEHLPDTTKTKVSGIYKIINRVNGKYYVGSTDDIQRRWYNHRIELQGNRHGNQYLQYAWNKYGEQNFEFLLVEATAPDSRLSVEQSYLDACNNNRDVSYNIGRDAVAFMLGKHHTKETRAKISAANRGRTKTLETKLKQSNAMRGRYDGSKNPNYGRKHTPEELEKMLRGRMDKTIYTFKNSTTQEIFNGTRTDFKNYTGIGTDFICLLVNGKSKSCHGWVLSY